MRTTTWGRSRSIDAHTGRNEIVWSVAIVALLALVAWWLAF